MAYEIGTATGHLELLRALRRVLLGYGTAAAPSYTGAGNGTLTGVQPLTAAVTETWTLTCTAGGPTGTFSVTGSVSGAKAAATVGTPYDNGLIQFTINDGSIDFIVGDQFTVAVTQGVLAAQRVVSFAGTGNGTLSPAAVYPGYQFEQWTIKCTATAANGGTFSVTGSVSGAQANATVGTHYDNGKLKFTINDGATDFALNDTFTLTSPVWQELRWQDYGAGEWELIVKGPGAAGTDEVFVGIQTYSSVASDYYNWRIRGFIGYVPSSDFANQPGASPVLGVPLWQSATPYWITADGRRFTVCAKVSTVYEHCWGGLFLPYATPGEYPYPIAVAGMLPSDSATRWSDNSGSHSFGYRGANARFRLLDGTWATPQIKPFQSEGLGSFRPVDTDTFYAVQRLQLSLASPLGIYGHLDGLAHVTGFAQAVENTLTIDGDTHVVLQDVFRTGFNDYIALRLS